MALCCRAMKEETTVEFDGTVEALAPGDFYRVLLDSGHEVIARKNGAMSKHRITVAAGDKVKVEVSCYDTSRGRIIF